MTCQTCQRPSQTVAIGTSAYCALCGSRAEPAAEAVARNIQSTGTATVVTDQAGALTAPAAPASPGAAQTSPSSTQPTRPAPQRRSLDLKRGPAPTVINARGESARSLHGSPSAPRPRTLDLRAPVQARRGTVRVPQAVAPAADPSVVAAAIAPTNPAPAAPVASRPAAPAAVASTSSVVRRPATTAAPVTPTVTPARPRHHAHQSSDVAARAERARQTQRSEHVRRFDQVASVTAAPTTPQAPIPAPDRLQPTVAVAAPSVAAPPAPAAPPPPRPALPIPTPERLVPAAAVTTHEALTRLAAKHVAAQAAAATPAAKPLAWTHYAGAAAAVALIGGYIWLENYPKLSIRSAAATAGVSATTPTYLPTSYKLTSTNAAPGEVTLSFKSPSQPATLTIGQQHTAWDSKSLVDNYVAKADPEYTSVNGQGLTIYLMSGHQATWVNHGIMYSIKGTARLSQDQILKIAYGL